MHHGIIYHSELKREEGGIFNITFKMFKDNSYNVLILDFSYID